jgi:transcriptional antiterminator NusG
MTANLDDVMPTGSDAADLAAAGGRAVPADQPPHEATAASPVEADEDDDGPVELEDPFAGDENAKPVEVASAVAVEQPVGDMQWYILKVQSNREDSIRETLMRRIAMQGMGKWFGEVIVPRRAASATSPAPAGGRARCSRRTSPSSFTRPRRSRTRRRG